MSEVVSIGQAVREASARLAAISDSPRLDAEVLAAHALGKSRGSLFAYDRDAMSEATRLRLLELVEARSRQVPVAYLTGHKEFWTLRLRVTPDVLVPRPETELLVEWALELLPKHDAAPRRVLDLGTGSGAIALSLASERSQLQVTATDASAAALEVARGNAAELGLDVRFLLGDWWSALGADERFDLVLSNPPYIALGDAHLQKLQAEPQSALTAGSDGLADLRRIIAGAAAHLQPGGWLLVEHGYDQGEAVRALFASAGFNDVSTRRDLGGQDRASGGRLADAGSCAKVRA